jgi:hypothetical protein
VTRVNSAGEAVSTYRLELLRKIVTVPYRGKNLRIVAFPIGESRRLVSSFDFSALRRNPI